MRMLMLVVCLVGCVTNACARTEAFGPDAIVALERAALDRWGKGDPRGFLEIMDRDITYFDPVQDRRVDGLDAMQKLLEPFTGKLKIDRYEMLNPRVHQNGNLAVLTFNLVNYLRQPNGTEGVLNRWNSTEVYQQVGGSWKIVHSHWSYIKPQLK
jgi:ketosteroid isomerase-like protein